MKLTAHFIFCGFNCLETIEALFIVTERTPFLYGCILYKYGTPNKKGYLSILRGFRGLIVKKKTYLQIW